MDSSELSMVQLSGLIGSGLLTPLAELSLISESSLKDWADSGIEAVKAGVSTWVRLGCPYKTE